MILLLCPCFSTAQKWSIESKSNLFHRQFSNLSRGIWQMYNPCFCSSKAKPILLLLAYVKCSPDIETATSERIQQNQRRLTYDLYLVYLEKYVNSYHQISYIVWYLAMSQYFAIFSRLLNWNPWPDQARVTYQRSISIPNCSFSTWSKWSGSHGSRGIREINIKRWENS